ncbi:MAG: cyclic nucleotide-binding protein [Aeromicrobium sp.]|jgi:CRP/FNR family cyclic AMP-dependent transcriptional regulator|uniref:cyclic nucleotide-binding domain-containing protein n=1 Tax=Aeromicrobium sp. TaxID=1871063 RepID=UPI002633AAB4|nr:cyclic nucleotide-binding domain-containing protein [Aeromicrobium sp.]MCW2790551.1 cyclic nucleotide-binding protein [Aeromicrobium sp.]MCW2823383.1 cyclic nucleotide-binding protein [Aeromicrobium sp.]
MFGKPKADPEVVEALTRSTGFDPSLVERLATVGTAVNIPAGWSVIMESTPADSAYIVLDGSAEIRKGGATIATLGAGDVFGEIALVNHRLRSASVIAATPLRALRLGSEAISELVEHDSGFADSLRASADQRLAD